MSPQMPQRPDSSSSEVDTRVDLFQGLTQIPDNIFDTFFGGEPESKEAISEIVNNRVVVLAERRGISEWALCEEIAERTDLELSVVLSFIHGTMDLGDSLPLTILQAELGVRLCDL